ncbi:MAG: hypothetical protein IJ165_03720 [Proteobacteria bacterium]|nr:hypothetical protein [Pseudomonadota bacterium]
MDCTNNYKWVDASIEATHFIAEHGDQTKDPFRLVQQNLNSANLQFPKLPHYLSDPYWMSEKDGSFRNGISECQVEEIWELFKLVDKLRCISEAAENPRFVELFNKIASDKYLYRKDEGSKWVIGDMNKLSRLLYNIRPDLFFPISGSASAGGWIILINTKLNKHLTSTSQIKNWNNYYNLHTKLVDTKDKYEIARLAEEDMSTNTSKSVSSCHVKSHGDGFDEIGDMLFNQMTFCNIKKEENDRSKPELEDAICKTFESIMTRHEHPEIMCSPNLQYSSNLQIVYPIYSPLQPSGQKELRTSEQELKQTFLRCLSVDSFNSSLAVQHEHVFSVETPTIDGYDFSKTPKVSHHFDEDPGTSARFDMTIYEQLENRRSIINHIEFKHGNGDRSEITKDLLKLSNEPYCPSIKDQEQREKIEAAYGSDLKSKTHYFIHLIDSFNRKTLQSLTSKYFGWDENLRIHKWDGDYLVYQDILRCCRANKSQNDTEQQEYSNNSIYIYVLITTNNLGDKKEALYRINYIEWLEKIKHYQDKLQKYNIEQQAIVDGTPITSDCISEPEKVIINDIWKRIL